MPPFAKKLKKSLPLFAAVLMVFSARGAETNKKFYAYAESEVARTKTLFEADKTNSTNAWHYARACFDLGEIATNSTQKAEIARLGIAASQHLLAQQPKSAMGHYCLGLNFGELADAEAPSLTAYKLVHQIEREFLRAAELDPHLDHAGPARCLGLLYRDAPGWPISIGSKHKSREWFERAAKLSPDYPENHLNLAETHLRWRQRDEAAAALKKLDAVWSPAQTNLVGEAWEKSWSDWTRQRAAAKTEFQKQFKQAP